MQRLLNQIEQAKKSCIYLQAQFDDASKRLEQQKNNLTELTKLQSIYSQSSALFKEASIACQQQTNQRICNIITKLYRFVFENNDEIVIETDIKRNVPIASITIKSEKNGEVVMLDPIEEEGGGKLDIISLGLRLAGLLLFTPPLNRVLILDEPLKNLSTNETSAKAYRQRTAEFLKMICEDYDIQIIMTTHDKAFIDMADKKFTVELDDEEYSYISNRDTTSEQ